MGTRPKCCVGMRTAVHVGVSLKLNGPTSNQLTFYVS